MKGMLNKNNKHHHHHQNTLKSAGEISSPSNSSSQLSMGQIPRSLLVNNNKMVNEDASGGVERIGNEMGRDSEDEEV